MSETTSPSPDVMQVATQYAQNNVETNAQAERMQHWMGDPTKVDQQTAQDIVDYLSTQPYQDKNGSIHDPESGQFVKHNDFHNDKEDAHYDETQAKSNDQKTLKDLIAGWAEADDAGDKTASDDIQDEVMNRIEREKGLTEDHKVAMIDVVYNKKEQLRASNSDKKEDKSEDPFAKPPVAGTGVGGEAPEPKNTFDKPPVTAAGVVSKELTAEDRVIRSYVNAEGKPLAGFNELNNELAQKVKDGNETDWNNLVQTLRDAVKYDASNEANTRLKLEGETVEDRLKSFEAYASAKYKELKANQPKEGGEEGPVVIPVIVEQTEIAPIVATPEAKSRRGRKIAAGILAAGLLLGGAFGLKKALDSDDAKGKVGTEQPVNTSPTNNPELPGSTTTTAPEVTGSDKDTTATLGYDITDQERADANLTDWTWNVAHNVAPGHEAELIQKGVDAYNTAHAAEPNYSNFELGKATINGKSTTVIKNGTGHIVSPAEMEEINMRMLAE